MNESEKHVLEYLILLTVLAVVLSLFYIFRYNDAILKYVALIGSVAYTLWGILHHAIEDRVTKAIVLEYISIGALVFLLLYNIISL